MKQGIRIGLVAGLALSLLLAQASQAQEKKNLRRVFVSLAWNSEIPFRAALARGCFKQQGLQGASEIVSAAWDPYSSGLTSDLSIATAGLQQMLDEDIRNGRSTKISR